MGLEATCKSGKVESGRSVGEEITGVVGTVMAGLPIQVTVILPTRPGNGPEARLG